MAELREVASGSATQCLWLRNGKVGSQISGINRSRYPGRRTVGEVRRGGRQGRRASDKAKKRVEDLAALSAREVKRAAAEERERDEYSSADEQCQSKWETKSFQRAF